MPDCRAKRELDEMHCLRCHLRWDVNDSDPPPCGENRIRPEQWQALYESIMNGKTDKCTEAKDKG